MVKPDPPLRIVVVVSDLRGRGAAVVGDFMVIVEPRPTVAQTLSYARTSFKIANPGARMANYIFEIKS